MPQKFSLDLKKSSSAFRLSLDKAGVPPDIRAELLVVMDVSGSFEHEHKEGRRASCSSAWCRWPRCWIRTARST